MVLRIRFERPKGLRKLALLTACAVVALSLVAFVSVFTYYYFAYKSVVDQRLGQPIFADTAQIYAAPREVRPGQKLSVKLLASELRQAGYTADGTAQTSPLGTYNEGVQQITVRPGPQSFHAPDSAVIHVSGGVVDTIVDAKGQQLESYELEPLLITGLSESQNRIKRRLITYDEIPQNLVNAVVAIEDRRFFEHSGVDYRRIVGAIVNDLKPGHRLTEGGSTLTMQLARGFFLTPERRLKRKIIEITITFQLENRFTKQQIFQMYANEINLGQRGSFSID